MTEFKQKIHDLRVKVEECAKRLKELESSGKESDANDAIWLVYGTWNSKEYSALESTLRSKGHRSDLDELNQKK